MTLRFHTILAFDERIQRINLLQATPLKRCAVGNPIKAERTGSRLDATARTARLGRQEVQGHDQFPALAASSREPA
ncbi:hypothetical protein SAMN05216264_12510 [Pseudomonas marincola]|nr:hypothetical protein SAMN05216264_12510 [Pseudomonas marincola]